MEEKAKEDLQGEGGYKGSERAFEERGTAWVNAFRGKTVNKGYLWG